MKKPQKNRIKFRKTWGQFSPVSRVKPSKKIYNRKFIQSIFED